MDVLNHPPHPQEQLLPLEVRQRYQKIKTAGKFAVDPAKVLSILCVLPTGWGMR